MQVTLEPWGADDIDVLRRTNTAELTRYLGGVEPDEALVERHAEYLDADGGARMFRVEVDGDLAGYAGWWEQDHGGAPAYEVGCVIEPAWQGRGVATRVVSEVVRRAAEVADGRPIVGYASVENEASRALCLRVGFTLTGTALFPAVDGGEALTVDVWMIETSR